MKHLYLTGLLFLAMSLTSCFGPGVTTQTTPGDNNNRPRTVDRDPGYYDDRKTRDEDRDRVLRDSRSRYKGKACEDEARGHDCKDQCRDIYTRRGDKEDCEELSVSQVEVLHELHELLEDPDDDALAEIDDEDFDVYLNISIDPLDKLIGRYSKKEAREFLIWLIESESSANVFEKEDEDFKAFENLLENISGNISGTTIYEPFLAKLDGSDKVMEVAIESGSEEIIEWFMDFINEKNSDCEEDEEDVDCFKMYCKIGDDIDSDYRDDWIGFEQFEDYIDGIIEEGVNKSGTHSGVHYWGFEHRRKSL